MSRAFAWIGGGLFVASLAFAAFSYTWRFESAGRWSLEGWTPAAIDLLMFTVFALHHSVFARASVKARIARHLAPHLERSMYVWLASVLFLATCAAWRPVPGVLWHLSGAPAGIVRAMQFAGVALTILAARRLDALSLAGIRQAAEAGGPEAALDETGPYGIVRHPIYLGWFLMVWGTPVMNGTRLVFAAASCLYLLLAIPYEERALRRTFGAAYDGYMRRVRWKVIPRVH